MVAVIPQKTVFRTVRADSLPRQFRDDISDEAIVEVLVKTITDENGLTQEDRERLDEALREVDEEFDTLPVYSAEEYLAHLREMENK